MALMVYITNWQEFQEAAEHLYDKSPQNTRYCVKWRGVDGVLVLKITDNTTCLKYKTRSSIFLNRFEALNLNLMRRMQNRRLVESAPGMQTSEGAQQVQAAGAAPQGDSGAVPAPAGPSNSGVKKKKGRKKK